jgi:hypothetical protein
MQMFNVDLAVEPLELFEGPPLSVRVVMAQIVVPVSGGGRQQTVQDVERPQGRQRNVVLGDLLQSEAPRSATSGRYRRPRLSILDDLSAPLSVDDARPVVGTREGC